MAETRSTKEQAMADIGLIAATRCTSNLIGWQELEAMYEAVVYRRRWYRRLWNWLAERKGGGA